MKSLLPKLFVPVWVLLLSACTGSEETGKSKMPLSTDTMITVMKDGKELQLTVPFDRFLVREIMHIDTVMREYKGRALEKEIRSFVDITGDGEPDETIAYVWMDEDACRVNYTIRLDGNIIWNDSLAIDASYGEAIFSDTSGVYEKLWPYSGFSAGLDLVRTVVDPSIEASRFIDEPVTTSMREEELKGRGMDVYDRQVEVIRFKRYLADFKGVLVKKLSIMDGGVYIWYEPEKKLIDLYEP